MKDSLVRLSCWSSGVAITILLSAGFSWGENRSPGSVQLMVRGDSQAEVAGKGLSPLRFTTPSPLNEYKDRESFRVKEDSSATVVKVRRTENQSRDHLLERRFFGSYRHYVASTGRGDPVEMIIGHGEKDTLGRRLQIVDDTGEHSTTVITARILSYTLNGDWFRIQTQINGLFIGARRVPHENDRRPLRGTAFITLQGKAFVTENGDAVILVGQMRFSGTASLVDSYNRRPMTFGMHGWLK